jgi:hypothetical protein
MFAGSSGPGNVGSKSVPFSRAVTAADTAFASTTVTFPRSTKPKGVQLAASAVAALVQVQGLGVEFYATTVVVNTPKYLDLSGYPETTSIVIQSEILGAATLAGSVDYA